MLCSIRQNYFALFSINHGNQYFIIALKNNPFLPEKRSPHIGQATEIANSSCHAMLIPGAPNCWLATIPFWPGCTTIPPYLFDPDASVGSIWENWILLRKHIRGRCKDHKPQLLIYGGPVQGCVKCGLGSELMIMPRWVCAAWRINVIYWSSSSARIGYWWVIMLMYIVNAVVHCSMLVILAVGCDVFWL